MKKTQVINHYTAPNVDPLDTIGFALALYRQSRTSFPAYNRDVVWPSAYARARQHRNTALRAAA